MLSRIVLALFIGLIGWAYQAIQPPPPKICGSPNGPPVISPRIILKDGRHLAYTERGIPKEKARYKIVIVHGLSSSKDFTLPASKKLVEQLGIYFVSFDRAGYGESDPNPKRSVKSEAFDIQELADQLNLGSRFYVLAVSMGGYSIWSCIKYIPHRLAGAALVVPVVNYWWPSFPANLSTVAYNMQLLQDQRTLRIAHHARPFFHFWMTQKWFPSSAAIQGHPDIFSRQDKELIQRMMALNTDGYVQDKARQQGDFESIHRDLMVGFGSWEFDPMEIDNPFPQNEASVHLWQGCDDKLVPLILQRYVAKKLPWIKYHEVPDGGHLLFLADGMSDTILKSLLIGQEPPPVSC
ncbi:putative lysophospholipase BODYGUARD 2 [Tasmannia lanceolata]|uniref:putative lysophospholipase BODYGUARD 2 n=1 Tax=Tasmannia lanceolata TaxID=3420 RepID=UPI004063B385